MINRTTNVVVSFRRMSETFDPATFDRRFPDVQVAHVDYQVPPGELLLRAERPEAAAADRLSDAQLEAFSSADVIVGLCVPLDLATVAPKARWIQSIGSGVGHLAASAGISDVLVTNAPAVGAPPIAEWVVAQVLAIYKELEVQRQQQLRHQWKHIPASLIRGRSALVVGAGAIGTEVAGRLSALGIHVEGVRRRIHPHDALPVSFASLHPATDLHSAAARADTIVAAVPGTPSNSNMFDRAFFASMPRGSIFVNVGRGSTVDEVALIDALTSGHLRGAATDVAKTEPLPVDDPLWDAPNLFISPHSAVSGEGYMERAWEVFAENLERFLSHRPLANVVDLAAEYHRVDERSH